MLDAPNFWNPNFGCFFFVGTHFYCLYNTRTSRYILNLYPSGIPQGVLSENIPEIFQNFLQSFFFQNSTRFLFWDFFRRHIYDSLQHSLLGLEVLKKFFLEFLQNILHKFPSEFFLGFFEKLLWEFNLRFRQEFLLIPPLCFLLGF